MFALVLSALPAHAAVVVPDPDPAADATASIQAALDEAASGKRVVTLEPGTYRITATLNVPDGVVLQGSSPRWEDGSTRIAIEQNGFSAVRLNNGSCVKGLAFTYPNNGKGNDPEPYPPTLLLTGINPSVEQVVFGNAWIGIAPPPEGANTGQSLFRDITGFVHKTGIRIDGALDIVRIEDVHWFVPGYPAEFYRRERVGFEFGRVDGLLMARCFMIGGKTFIHQQATTGAGEKVHSLGLHITQCWTESVTYGVLIEGTCGLVLSDTQIYVSDPQGAGIAMRMPYLFYHSTITNTQVRCDGSNAIGIEYAPTDDHPRNHLHLSGCAIDEASTGVILGEEARRVWVLDNLIRTVNTGIHVQPGASEFVLRDNMISGESILRDDTAPDAVKQISGNMQVGQTP